MKTMIEKIKSHVHFPTMTGNYQAIQCLALIVLTILCQGCHTVPPQALHDDEIERAYGKRLTDWFNNKLPPETRYSGHLFLTEKLINEVLVGLVGAEVPLSTTSPAKFQFQAVQTQFRDGFPLVRATGRVKSPESKWTADVDVWAVLEVLDEDQLRTPDTIEVKLHFYRLDEATVRYSSALALHLRGIVKELAERKLTDLTDGIRPFNLPSEGRWAFQIPNAPERLKIPAPAGGSVTLSFNRQTADVVSELQVARVVFLRDGIHLFGNLSLETRGKRIEVVSVNKPNVDYAALSPEEKANRLLCTNESFRIEVSQATVAQCVNLLNSTEQAFKSAKFQSVSTSGTLFTADGGPFLRTLKFGLSKSNSVSGSVSVKPLRFESNTNMGRIYVPLAGDAKARIYGGARARGIWPGGGWFSNVDIHGALSNDTEIEIDPSIANSDLVLSVNSAKGKFKWRSVTQGSAGENAAAAVAGHRVDNGDVDLKDLKGVPLAKVKIPNVLANQGRIILGNDARNYNVVIAATTVASTNGVLRYSGKAHVTFSATTPAPIASRGGNISP